MNINHLQKLVGDGRIELHFNCSMQKVKVAKFILFSENVLILIIVQLQGVPKNALLDTTAVFEDDFLFLDNYYISFKCFKQMNHTELQIPEKVYQTGFGISSTPQDCLFLLLNHLLLSLLLLFNHLFLYS